MMNKADPLREQEEECHLWLTENLQPRKTSSIMSMLEQMVEMRSWKAACGIIGDESFRACHGHNKTAAHLVAGCTALSNSEYFARHKV